MILEQQIRELLEQLSVGLFHQLHLVDRKPVNALNLDPQLRQGWEALNYLLYSRDLVVQPQDEPVPQTVTALVVWCHRPLDEWPIIGTQIKQAGITGALLENGDLTETARELAGTLSSVADPDLEQQDMYFYALMQYAREHALPGEYSSAREFLIRNPVVDDVMDILNSRQWSDGMREKLAACYETIPIACQYQDGRRLSIYTCPRCGWPLIWNGDQPHCYKNGSCEALNGDLHEQAKVRPYDSAARRTKEGIQRFVVGSEIGLIQLSDRLQHEFGLTIELFPNIDAYDLRIGFPNGDYWAVDFKDHKNPAALANDLNTKAFPAFPPWKFAFYVFGDERATPGYLESFHNTWRPQLRTTFLAARDFIIRVQERLNR